MKKAFGITELLIIVVIIIVIFISFRVNSVRKSPFDELKEVNTQSQEIEARIKSVEETKALRNKIEENLQKGY